MLQTIGVLSILEGEIMDEARRLWKLFETEYASQGVQSFDYPNLTFQGGSCSDVLALEHGLDDLARRLVPFDIIVKGLGYFESKVVYMQVQPTPELQEIHRTVSEWLKPYCKDPFERYLPESWVPHITIAMKDLTDENFKRAMHDLKTYHPRYRQTLSNLTFVQVSNETGQIDIVKQVRLG